MDFFKSLDTKLASLNPNNFIKPESKSRNNSAKTKLPNNSFKYISNSSRSNKNDELEELFKNRILENQDKNIGPYIESSIKIIQEIIEKIISGLENVFSILNDSIEKVNKETGGKPLPKFEKADLDSLFVSIKAIEELSNNQEDIQNISQAFGIFLINFDKNSKMKMLLKLAGIDISYLGIIKQYPFVHDMYTKSIQTIIKHKDVFAFINQLKPKLDLLLDNKHFITLMNVILKMPPVQTQIQTYMPDKKLTEIVLRFYLTTREIAQINSDLSEDCNEVWQATRGFIGLFCTLLEKFKESLPSNKIPDQCLKYTN